MTTTGIGTTAHPAAAAIAKRTAETIRSQIQLGVFMSLGATRPLYEVHKGQPGLTFQACVLPFTETGDRSTDARTMRVHITLNPADTYDIEVLYTTTRNGETTTTEHHAATDVYVDQLNPHLLALDYDGDTVLNPRYA